MYRLRFYSAFRCAVSKACFKEDKSRKPEENTKAKVLGNKKPEEQNAVAKDSGKEKSNLQYKDLKDQIQELKISISELRKQKEQQMAQKLEKDSGKQKSKVKKVNIEDQREDSKKSIFEAQKQLKEQHIAHKLVLEALNNGVEYIGPSYSRRYYY